MICELNKKHIQNLGKSNAVNCWGTTLFIHNLIDYPRWITSFEMLDFLYEYTDQIKTNRPEIGDIYVMKSYGKLIHTAVYVGNATWFHKSGNLTAETCHLSRLKTIYKDTQDEIVKIDIQKWNKNNKRVDNETELCYY